jgi:hypothetical protein
LRSALLCFVHYVVMHQRGDVNKLNDHRKIDMPGIDFSGGTACKQGQHGPKAFTPASDRIQDVTFNCGIECRGLLRNTRLDLLEMRLD